MEDTHGKGGAMELDPLALKILSSLIFEEPFEFIYQESGEPDRNIVSDVLRVLIVKDLVRVFEKQDGRFIPVAHIEPDTYSEQYFRITAKGMRYI
ncbi:MAG: hypothetical protein J5I91_10010 [Bacteroidetes bacterium]|nr:hypothetical protein [Bacteroidota bacterium]